MDTLNSLITALLASSAVGIGVSFIIQLGKLWFPKAFPDASADNWRLGLIVLTAVVIMVLNQFGIVVTIPAVEAYANSIAALGAVLMPLLVLISNWIAKVAYVYIFKGVKWVGKSYTG